MLYSYHNFKKKKERKIGNEISIGGFETFRHIPGTLEGRVHVQGYAYAKES